jgi:hypothetical protein
MLENSELSKLTIHASSPNSTIVAFAKVGNGPRRNTSTAQGNCKFAAVAVDYFTKWVEVKALVNITAPI